MTDRERLNTALQTARGQLLAARCAGGHWVGELANSAVSTATAVSALALIERHAGRFASYDMTALRGLIDRGAAWLLREQNPDGGWGDTDKSLSNIATTMLAQAALQLAGATPSHADALRRATHYVERHGGLTGLRRRYGKDKTFAVPILANCALAGMVPWRMVPALPFELAALPHAFFRFLRLPVVSYAIPALVAIGQARHYHAKPWNPLLRIVRAVSIGRSLKKAASMQPESGGYLEATPLTAFVTMSLASTQRANHPIARRGVAFLTDSVRDDGGWPIDTNLATWLTSLSISALACASDVRSLSDDVGISPACLSWLLDCQHRGVHPFTNAAPGGWGWTDLSGAVPDADDTPGALLALSAVIKRERRAPAVDDRIRRHASGGVRWLLRLQNRDGGWPTFCRGWGTMPFDRSGVDLTAHALRALGVWSETFPELRPAMAGAVRRGFRFLQARQRKNGSWLPLWFGNQFRTGEENPIYGTARVLLAYAETGREADPAAQRGVEYLLGAANADGGWGGGPEVQDEPSGPWRSSVEETAVALEGLASVPRGGPLEERLAHAVGRAANWLVERIEEDTYRETSPIGFYFAKLWYYEKLYPSIFTVAALGRVARRIS